MSFGEGAIYDLSLDIALTTIGADPRANKQRQRFLASQISNPISVPGNETYSEEVFADIRDRSIEHYVGHCTPKETAEQILLIEPFRGFLVDSENLRIRQHHTGALDAYASRLQVLLENTRLMPTVGVTVFTKPDMYVAGISKLVKNGLVNKVVFLDHAGERPLVIDNSEYDASLDVQGKNVFLAGMYESEGVASITTLLREKDVYSRSSAYSKLQYIDDVLFDFPRNGLASLFQIPKWLKDGKRGITTSNFIKDRMKTMSEPPALTSIKGVVGKN